MQRIKITKVGNSEGFIFPKELFALHNLKKGDELFVTPTKDGYSISFYDKEIEEQMDAAEKGMSHYKNTLKKLAK